MNQSKNKPNAQAELVKILFVTSTYPWPGHAGDLLFTRGLIEALSRDNGINLTVYCSSNLPVNAELAGRVHWKRGVKKHPRLQDFRSLFSNLPRAATRALCVKDIKELSRLTRENAYDIVLLNEGSTGDAISVFSSELLRRSVYISHNVNAEMLPEVARNVSNPLLRKIQEFDAVKHQKLEQRLMNAVGAIAAISEVDYKYFKSHTSGKTVFLLKPGYSGPICPSREILTQTPRVAALVGSFYWNAKQKNLLELLAAYKRYRDSNGAAFSLRIAGAMPPQFHATLQLKYPDVEIQNGFDKIDDVLKDVRAAFVLERLGGGFKLKVLDYIFQRVPIIAFDGAMAGSGLQPNTEYISVQNFDEAMRSTAKEMDNLDNLNQIQKKAFDSAVNRFFWQDRVERLKEVASEVQPIDIGNRGK